MITDDYVIETVENPVNEIITPMKRYWINWRDIHTKYNCNKLFKYLNSLNFNKCNYYIQINKTSSPDILKPTDEIASQYSHETQATKQQLPRIDLNKHIYYAAISLNQFLG